MKKRGISDIITILLLILLVIIAIIIIWYVASKFAKEQGEISEAKAKFFYEHYAITKLEYNSKNPDPLSSIKMTLSKKSGRTQLAGTEKITQMTSPVIDLISVVDLSSSMTQTIPGTTTKKIDAAKIANKDLVNNILNLEAKNRVGIVGYDANIISKSLMDLTSNVLELNTHIDKNLSTGSGTNICAGINKAAEKLKAQSPSEKTKLMIVMSDGQASRECDGVGQNSAKAKDGAIKAACDANKTLKNLIIYSVGFGDADEDTMNKIAKCGNGKYFKADVDEIIDIYKAVVKEIEATIYKPVQIVNYIRVVFYSSSNSYSEDIKDIPKEVHDTKTYAFNVKDKVPDLKKIEIYPIIVLSSGKEIIGPIIAKQEF